jgi:hypothetical protein
MGRTKRASEKRADIMESTRNELILKKFNMD